jgi:hypothetical protein
MSNQEVWTCIAGHCGSWRLKGKVTGIRLHCLLNIWSSVERVLVRPYIRILCQPFGHKQQRWVFSLVRGNHSESAYSESIWVSPTCHLQSNLGPNRHMSSGTLSLSLSFVNPSWLFRPLPWPRWRWQDQGRESHLNYGLHALTSRSSFMTCWHRSSLILLVLLFFVLFSDRYYPSFYKTTQKHCRPR